MPASPITELLHCWGKGDQEALQKLLPLIYDPLRRRARFRLKNERSNMSWQGTELVHELYFDLEKMAPVNWQNQDQFYAFAVHRMRLILVDHARHKFRKKRGGTMIIVRMSELEEGADGQELNLSLLELHHALRELERHNPRQAQVVELKCFGGYSVGEIARMLKVSPATIKRDWTEALTGLRERMG